MNDRGENRQQIWDDYLADGGMYHKNVRHMFTEYNRYYEADLITLTMQQRGVDLTKLKVLDYGCGAGDYGIEFCRKGASVSFYDFPRSTQLVAYRLGREKLSNGHAISADHHPYKRFHSKLINFDLIIFGEVLEHLDNPLAILKQINTYRVKYIFTSSYPYRSTDKKDPYWSNADHENGARLLIPECQKLLEENYDYQQFTGQLRLWERKPKSKILTTKNSSSLIKQAYK